MATNIVVDVTGTTPQTLAPALTPGRAYRVLGFGLTSSGSGIAILKAGTRELARVQMPGGEVLPPNVDWAMIGGTEHAALTIEADTAAVRVVGHLAYDTVPVPIVPATPIENFLDQSIRIGRRQPLNTGPNFQPIPVAATGLV